MSYIRAVYQDLNQCCDEFVKGVELLEQCFIKDAVNYFRRACESVIPGDQFYLKYKSYYGFSRLLNGENSAIGICRSVVEACPFDGDICMNLARAEIVLSNRLEALEVIEMGLRFSTDHDGLKALKKKIGVRTRKPLPLLSRNNPLSSALGRRMRKRYR